MDISEQPAVTTDETWNSFTVQLRRFIASRVHTEADVDDILQEVFIKIHRAIDKLKIVRRENALENLKRFFEGRTQARHESRWCNRRRRQ